MFEKELIIDGKGHMQGRLASVVAKELISGQRVVVVRCEQILKSGSLRRNRIIRTDVMKKRINTNPRRGAKHWKAPSRMFWKVTRVMLPHKLPKGTAALNRLKCFDGIPYPYDQKKRMVIPDALKCLRLKSRRKYCTLEELATVTGWTKAGVISTLEDKRKEKSSKFYAKKSERAAARTTALKDKRLDAYNKELSKLGF